MRKAAAGPPDRPSQRPATVRSSPAPESQASGHGSAGIVRWPRSRHRGHVPAKAELELFVDPCCQKSAGTICDTRPPGSKTVAAVEDVKLIVTIPSLPPAFGVWDVAQDVHCPSLYLSSVELNVKAIVGEWSRCEVPLRGSIWEVGVHCHDRDSMPDIDTVPRPNLRRVPPQSGLN